MTSIETSSSKRQRSVLRTAPSHITVPIVRAMRAPQVRADGGVPPGAGRLKVRKRKTPRGGVVTEWLFVWHTRLDEQGASGPLRVKTITLGKFNDTGERSREGFLTIDEARLEAGKLREQIRAGIDPALAKTEARHEARREQATRLQRLRETTERTFESMLDGYVAHLEHLGKPSAYDARNIFANHVKLAFPHIAQMPAAEVTPEHIAQVLARLVRPRDGTRPKGRTALKLRAYMSAAYRLALGATRDPMVDAAVAGFGVETNAAAAVSSTRMAAMFNRKGERTLSEGELRAFMERVEEVPSMVNRLALQLQLATGGQRVEQLLRLTPADVGETTFALFDPKGRRAQPRRHVLPLLVELEELLAQLRCLASLAGGGDRDSLFLSRPGVVVNPETLSGEVARISGTMLEAEEAKEPFRLGDIRRTCETMMAGTLGISKDTRAQLLSHGISGVQDTHYDKGDHLDAKQAALSAWIAHLERIRIGAVRDGNVVPFRAKAAF